MKSLVVALVLALQAPPLLPVGTFRLEPGAGRVEFHMRDNRGGFTGATDRVEATVSVRKTDPETYEAAVDARVDARTLTTGVGLRDAQMRRDFLQTDRYPFIVFAGVVRVPETAAVGPLRTVVRGRLTIRDVARPVEIPIQIVALADEYRVDGETTVRLSEFRIPTPRFLIFVAEDAVTVRVRARLRRAD